MGEAAVGEDPGQMTADRLWGIAAAVVVTALSFWWFPGHTILQSDTQVYIPILQHLADPSVLARDEMAVRPHVAFTVYDDVALALRRVTGMPFEDLLTGQQLLFRAVGVIGLFLIARSAGLGGPWAFAVAALLSLGATVNGPQVLTVEYEPVPRGFAFGLVLLGLGLAARGNWMWAAASATAAFAYHPPTALVIWALLGAFCVWERRWSAAGVLLIGPLLIVASMLVHPAGREHVALTSRIPEDLESILRMRASYNWVSTWIGQYWPHFTVLLAAAFLGAWRSARNAPPVVRVAMWGLPAVGAFSVLVSWLVLEHGKWLLGVQFQPARYLMYVPFFAALSCAIAAFRSKGVALLLLAVPVVVALTPDVVHGPVQVVSVSAGSQPAALTDLVRWARSGTTPDAVFQFADVRRGLEPGVFRVQAERAIFADWKSGGQVNFLPAYAHLWADRWKVVERAKPLSVYAGLGIDYVVFSAGKEPKGVTPVWRNDRWVVFRVGSADRG